MACMLSGCSSLKTRDTRGNRLPTAPHRARLVSEGHTLLPRCPETGTVPSQTVSECSAWMGTCFCRPHRPRACDVWRDTTVDGGALLSGMSANNRKSRRAQAAKLATDNPEELAEAPHNTLFGKPAASATKKRMSSGEEEEAPKKKQKATQRSPVQRADPAAALRATENPVRAGTQAGRPPRAARRLEPAG